MKTRIIAAIALSITLSLTAHAQVPGIINYQGRVSVGGTNFTGTGQFKFAMVDNGATFIDRAQGFAFVSGPAVGYQITGVNVTHSGSGYTNPPAIAFPPFVVHGTGAVLTANVSSGQVTSVTVNNPGTNYDDNAGGNIDLIFAQPPPQAFTYWSNGVSTVSVPVSNGLYSVLLGDTNIVNMSNLVPPSVFANSDVRLRVFFNDGVHGLQQLTPDQRIGAVGYAMQAANATTASTAAVALSLNSILSVTAPALQVGYFTLVNGNYSTVAGGSNNAVQADYSAIGGGYHNNATGVAATIGGGGNNTAANSYATVAGGQNNSASNTYATVAGGDLNSASGNEATVAGGTANIASGADSTVGGGQNNSAQGVATTIGGGSGNTATNDFATVGGGNGNNATGKYATVAGGGSNVASGIASFVGGGGHNGSFLFPNTASGTLATVGGGGNNVASGLAATVGGGASVIASGTLSTIGGGGGNTASGPGSFVGGGGGDGGFNYGPNIASGALSTIAGGLGNAASADYSTVGGGVNNSASNTYATVAGGSGNWAAGDHSTVGGGSGNTAYGNLNSLSVGYSTVGGGINNQANSVSTVGGGTGNGAYGFYATIGGGSNNAAGSNLATVGGGGANTASGSSSTVGGGGGNTASGTYATIPGGLSNTAGGDYSFAAGKSAQANFNNSFCWSDGSAPTGTGRTNQFLTRAIGGYYLFSSSGGVGVQVNPGDNSWSSISDRHMKENFTKIDPRAVLAKVAAMPVTEWNLITQDPSIRHIGPMAQDFKAAFGLGEDDRHISTTDADGIALAAIQGLYQELQAEKAHNAAKDAEIRELRQRLDELEKRMQK